jgi:hypothetical protein
MKIDKRIILYLDNQMNDEEKRIFEVELSKSVELSKQMESYKSIMHSMKIDENDFHDQDYFVNLIPRFRKNLSSNKKSFKVRTAYAFTAAASVLVIVVLIFNPFKSSENDSLEKLISTFSENEAVEILEYYSDDLSNIKTEQLNGTSDSLFSGLISSELNLQETDLKRLVSADEISIESIYSEIKSEEADLIYNEILKKKYF